MKIFYPGARGGAFGWGVFGDHITRQFAAMGINAQTIREADVCLMPLADHNFAPATNDRAAINCAVCFFEFELGPDVAERAKAYDVVFAGSTWCLDRMRERGITNGQLLIQGVDQSVFHPRPRRPDGQFRIFSGGKFEYRKGQDLVIRAFAEFAKECPEAHLVCAWHNPWPSLVYDAAQRARLSAYFYHHEPIPLTEETTFARFMETAGIATDRFTVLPVLSHAQLAEEMAQTDCGLFPNRCEGGTNLVLMEYAAMGRPVIANRLTGHADVSDLISVSIPAFHDIKTGWAAQSHTAIADCLAGAKAGLCRANDKPSVPTWRQTAETVANAVATLTLAV